MNWVVFHIASGQAFFTGIALVIVGVLASTRSHRLIKRLSPLALLIGGIAIVVSSTAIPYWYYGLAVLVTFVWGFSCFSKKPVHWPAYVAAAIWFGAALLELPYQFTPSLRPVAGRSMTVIGDSVSAGIGENPSVEAWPNVLARSHRLEIQNISHVGETAASALKRLRQQNVNSPIVLVEIGGNDLLGSTTVSQFAQDLEALLQHLADSDRQIVMFELPLPPFYHEYGRVQRGLAAKYEVLLIPKRVFLSVLAGSGATLDSIHLTQAGHERMADEVWEIVGAAYAEKQGE